MRPTIISIVESQSDDKTALCVGGCDNEKPDCDCYGKECDCDNSVPLSDE